MSPSAISQCSALTPSHTQNTFCCQQDILKKGCSATREERNEDWAMLLPPDVDSPHFAEPIFKKKTKQKTKWNSSFGFSFLSTSRKKPEITSIYNFVFGEGSLFLFFFFLNWGSVFQYSNFYKVFPACHQSPSSFMMFLTDGELTKHVSSLLQCKMLKATSMTY